MHNLGLIQDVQLAQLLWLDYATLLSCNYSRQSPANQLNTKILSAYMKGGIDGEPFFYHGYLVAEIIDDYILTKQSEALTRS